MRLCRYFFKFFILSSLVTGDPQAGLRENSTDLITDNTSTVNETLRCSARNIQGPVQSPQHTITVLIVRSVLVNYSILVAFFGTILNGFVIFLVIKFKVLHTLLFAFAIQIAITNIMGCTIYLPSSIVSVISNQWWFGEGTCIAVGAIFIGITITLRNLLMLIFVTDHFCSVFMPYIYPRHQTKILFCEVVAAYVLSAINATILGVLDCYSFFEASWTCTTDISYNEICIAHTSTMSFCLLLPSSLLTAESS